MAIEPLSCSRCHELEVKLRRADALLEQCYAQTRVARANQDIAMTALHDYFDPPPEEELRAV